MADEGESKKVAVQQIQRRTWDVDEYQRKADEKAAERQLEVSYGILLHWRLDMAVTLLWGQGTISILHRPRFEYLFEMVPVCR